jgi:hypothetical protein
MSDDSDYIETNTTSTDDSSVDDTSIKSRPGDLRLDRSSANNIEIEIENYHELEEEILEWIDEYIRLESLQYSSPEFEETLVEELAEFCYESWKVAGKAYEYYDDYQELIESLLDHYFEFMSEVPRRSYPYSTEIDSSSSLQRDIESIRNKITHLQTIPQPKQRTPEWYEFRNNLITASNLWKVFGTPSIVNSLIYEKCSAVDPSFSPITPQNIKTDSPMHWGVRYEPVTVMIYEKMFHTKISDFGCIPHSTVKCIGASPDGINTDETNPRLYGRMLEIKNIWNRDITGIPKEDYWIQTQIQLETCELEECDFVETRIKEYASDEEFYEQKQSGEAPEYTGVLLYFVQSTEGFDRGGENSEKRRMYDATPVYRYMPIDAYLCRESIDTWINHQKEECRRENLVLFQTIYWYLDEISTVLIRRNRLWFQAAKPRIQSVWDTILSERTTGYEHRLPRKRGKSFDVIVEPNSQTNDGQTQQIRNLPKNTMVCLIKLDEDGNIIT